MGQAPLVVSVATEVEASCKEVWAILSNIDDLPFVVTAIVSTERISSDEKEYKEGTRWKEIRKYNENDHAVTQIKTVTSIRQQDGGGKSVAINITFTNESSSGSINEDLTNTSTMEVQSIKGHKDKCILICSFGAMAGGLRGRCYFLFCAWRMKRLGRTLVLQELEEIGKAAVQLRNKEH